MERYLNRINSRIILLIGLVAACVSLVFLLKKRIVPTWFVVIDIVLIGLSILYFIIFGNQAGWHLALYAYFYWNVINVIILCGVLLPFEMNRNGLLDKIFVFVGRTGCLASLLWLMLPILLQLQHEQVALFFHRTVVLQSTVSDAVVLLGGHVVAFLMSLVLFLMLPLGRTVPKES